jgi:hypothetical protein
MVVQCPVGVSVSGIVIEVCVCGSDSIGIVKAVLWRVQCNMARSRSNDEDIMVVRCPVRRLGIVCRDRSCMLEQWATIHCYFGVTSLLVDMIGALHFTEVERCLTIHLHIKTSLFQ